MSFKNRFLLRDIRDRLTPKQVALFKLVLWSVLMVFLVFFATHTIITAQILARWAPAVFPQEPLYQTLARALPFWYVFTIGLIIVLIARYAYRKLKPKSYRQMKQALNNKTKEVDENVSES